MQRKGNYILTVKLFTTMIALTSFRTIIVMKHIFGLATFEYWENGQIRLRTFTNYTKWIPTIIYTSSLIYASIVCYHNPHCTFFKFKSVENFNKMLTIFIAQVTYYIVQIWSGLQLNKCLKYYNSILKIDEELKNIGISSHNQYAQNSKLENTLCLLISYCYFAIALAFDTRFNSNFENTILLAYMNMSSIVASCDYFFTMKYLGDRFFTLQNDSSLKFKGKFKIFCKLCDLIETSNELFSVQILAILARDFCILVRHLYIAAKYFTLAKLTFKFGFIVMAYGILHTMQCFAKIWISHSTIETVGWR